MKVFYRKMMVTIPVNAMSHMVQNMLTHLTRLAGGVTVHTADGYWYADGELGVHRDTVRVYSWALANDLDMAVWCTAIRKLYAEMFAAGEVSVYFEQYSPAGLLAGIIYPSDVEQEREH